MRRISGKIGGSGSATFCSKLIDTNEALAPTSEELALRWPVVSGFCLIWLRHILLFRLVSWLGTFLRFLAHLYKITIRMNEYFGNLLVLTNFSILIRLLCILAYLAYVSWLLYFSHSTFYSSTSFFFSFDF